MKLCAHGGKTGSNKNSNICLKEHLTFARSQSLFIQMFSD